MIKLIVPALASIILIAGCGSKKAGADGCPQGLAKNSTGKCEALCLDDSDCGDCGKCGTANFCTGGCNDSDASSVIGGTLPNHEINSASYKVVIGGSPFPGGSSSTSYRVLPPVQ